MAYITLLLAATAQEPLGAPGRLKLFLESNPGATIERRSLGRLASAQANADTFAVTAIDPAIPERRVSGLEIRLTEGDWKEVLFCDVGSLPATGNALRRMSEDPFASSGMIGSIGVSPSLEVTWYRHSGRTGMMIWSSAFRTRYYTFPGLDPESILSIVVAAETHLKPMPPRIAPLPK